MCVVVLVAAVQKLVESEVSLISPGDVYHHAAVTTYVVGRFMQTAMDGATRLIEVSTVLVNRLFAIHASAHNFIALADFPKGIYSARVAAKRDMHCRVRGRERQRRQRHLPVPAQHHPRDRPVAYRGRRRRAVRAATQAVGCRRRSVDKTGGTRSAKRKRDSTGHSMQQA